MNEIVNTMTETEARYYVDEIKSHVGKARAMLLDLYEREGWRALGYSSWRECVTGEFGKGQSYMYYQLQAAQVERNISTIVENDKPIPEGQLRPLTSLPPEMQVQAWRQAVDTAPEGKITAAHVQAVVAEMQEREILEAAKRIQAEKREQRRAERIEIITHEPASLDCLGPFNVIYADPPWRYEYSISTSREIENQYPTMTLEDICSLPVASISADDSVLFLWATSPKLVEAINVIEAWGFTYRTCMVWIKDKIGMGYYARQQHELLLIAARGNLPTPEPANRPPSVLYGERNTHSYKPEETYEVIEKMYPEFNKVELFCRNPREGWFSWGNQV